MLGRKTRTPPTPPMTPSTSSERSQRALSAGQCWLIVAPAHPKRVSSQPIGYLPTVKVRKSQPIGYLPTVKVRKKTAYISARKMGRPRMRLVTTASMVSLVSCRSSTELRIVSWQAPEMKP